MQSTSFDEIYKNVSSDQKELITKFRSSHHQQNLSKNRVIWKYISCGLGSNTLVLLPGGLGFYEALFIPIMALEDRFHIISPTYPQVPTMTELVEGIVGILDSEGIQKTNLFGVSFGGWLAQCFVHQYPERVNKLILSNTSGNDGFSTMTVKIGLLSARILPMNFLKFANKKRIMELISPTDTERPFWEAFLYEKFCYDITREVLVKRLQNTLDYMSNYRFLPDDLEGWEGQMLILESVDDLAFQTKVRDSLKLLYPAAQVCTLENAGHAPSHRGSPEYISAIKQFLVN
jgi:pimeloyl-ACP methyl ester carboxylesterase